MGTQQLLLIVLGVIIVGIAIVASISIVGATSQQGNADAVVSDCLRIAAGAQSYYARPTAFGGGNYSFVGLKLKNCGWKSPVNQNGSYSISDIHSTSAKIKGVGNANVTVTIVVYGDSVTIPSIRISNAEIDND